MSNIKHIWSCTCGEETEVEKDMFNLGSVFECPKCKKVYACVRPYIGGKVWIEVQPSDVKFHRLLEEYPGVG